jgi:adenylate cyclase
MASANGRLVPTGGGDPVDLYGDTIIIGRRPTCDIRMEFPNISGQHCRLSFREGYWYLEDLESQNGTKVGGTRLLPRALKLTHPGDLIIIGKREFKLEYVPSQSASPIMSVPELEDLTTPLMEKAGLERARGAKPKKAETNLTFDPADFLLEDELD